MTQKKHDSVTRCLGQKGVGVAKTLVRIVRKLGGGKTKLTCRIVQDENHPNRSVTGDLALGVR